MGTEYLFLAALLKESVQLRTKLTTCYLEEFCDKICFSVQTKDMPSPQFQQNQ